MTRLSAARLAEIEQHHKRWLIRATTSRGQLEDSNMIVSLIAELREVTRERDEAREYRAAATRAAMNAEHERDKLKQELADLDAKAGNEYAIVTHYKAEMERMAAEVVRLHEKYDLQLLVKRENALRAENAKLKAVAEESMALVAKLGDDCDDTTALWNALAALDPKEGA